ncbi:MAG: hypothetical protein AAGA47_02835 [Pseudomonadota bacterium]
MRDQSLLSIGFCLLFLVAGGAKIIENLDVIRDGLLVNNNGAPVMAQIVSKEIERPARKTGVRGESVAVNGTRVRSIRTYFYSYVFNVSFQGENGPEIARAVVSYDQWHNTPTGTPIEVTATAAAPAFVDATPRATLIYAAKHSGIGLLIILVGLAALFLPGEGDRGSQRRTSY